MNLRRFTVVALLVCLVGTSAQRAHAQQGAPSRAAVAESYGKLPLSFEANQGQTDPQVKFLSRGSGYTLFLTDSSAVLSLSKSESPAATGDRPSTIETRPLPVAQARRTDIVRMKLAGANRDTRAAGADPQPGKANYLIGNNPAKWHNNVPTYSRIQYKGVYPGIDLVYYGNQRKLEYDFDVAPGANPKHIRLQFEGAKQLSLTANGDLTVSANNGEILFHKPVVYQIVDGQHKPVEGQFSLLSRNSIGFTLGKYNKTKQLVIDPQLVYSTYFGKDSLVFGYAIAADSAGDVYVAGQTLLGSVLATAGAYQTAPYVQGCPEYYCVPAETFIESAFVTKLNPSGTALLYSTYLGGNAGEGAYGIAVDASGDAYVTGITSSTTFPVTRNALQLNTNAVVYTHNVATTAGTWLNLSSSGNAFVAELNPAGTSLVYSTYLGGSGSSTVNNLSGNTEYMGDVGTSIAVDGSGNIYVAGATASHDFPTTQSAIQRVNKAAPPATYDGVVYSNAFVAELNATGLLYSTYIGGSGGGGTGGGLTYWPVANSGDVAKGIALDSNGDAYVTGSTTSTDFPVTTGAFQILNNAAYNKADNAFVAKLNPTGTVLLYSTYLGGSGQAIFDSRGSGTLTNISGDTANGISVDASGAAYVTGSATSINFPTTSNAFQVVNKGAARDITTPGSNISNAFVTKINAVGTALSYSTYLGGSGDSILLSGGASTLLGDGSNGITVDASGDAYVTGFAYSTDYPVTADAYQSGNNAASNQEDNAVITELNPSGASLIYSTYLGGTGLNSSYGAADAANGIAIDGSGNIYVVGQATSTNFPVTTGVIETTRPNDNLLANYLDYPIGFVAKLNPNSIMAVPVVTVTTSLSSITSIQGVSVTVAVGGGSGNPTPNGTVILSSGSYTSPATTLSNGGAVIKIPAGALAVGTDILTASYSPNSIAYSGASGTNSINVTGQTTLILSTAPASSVYGQQVVLAATLAPYSSANNSTNGEAVTFSNGVTSLGAGVLSSGVATLNVTGLPVGTDSVVAVYAGDPVFITSTSNTLKYVVLPAAPTIVFAVANQTYGAAPFAVAATSNSSGVITYSVVSGPATISGGTMTLTGVGAVVLQASQIAVGSYAAGTQTATFGVAGSPPTLVFSVANHTYGNAPFTVAATSNSPAAVTYSVVSGPATIVGTTVTLTGAGTVMLGASQAASGTYAAGTQTATFTVAGVAPTISFTVANQTYGAAPFPVTATSNSSGIFGYSVVSGPATVSGSTMTLTGAGTVVLQASEAAAGNYAAGTQNTTFAVAAAAPTISFIVSNQSYGAAPFTVAATSNSTGAITYSVVSGPATVSGSTVTLTGIGSVSLKATQAATGNYVAGAQTTAFLVAAATPTISFSVPNHTYGDAPFSVAATSNSTAPITYSVVSGPATISGSTLTITGVGTIVIQASQVANGNYAAATQSAAFTVAVQAPTISFSVPNHTYGDAPFSVAATSNSSGTITYSVVSGPATISGSTVTLTGAAPVTLQASQAAAGNYSSSTQNSTFTVAGLTPTISISVPGHTYGDAPFAVAATSNSSGVLTYLVLSGQASVTGSTVTLTGAGSVTLQVSQAAIGGYTASTQNATFTVALATPTITFTVASQVYGATPFTVASPSNSPGAITYSVTSGPATIAGSTVTVTGIGTVSLKATQVATSNYIAGAQTATFAVAAATPTISFSIPNHTYGDAPFSVVATSNSTASITYSVLSGPATISGSTVTLTSSGSVTLQASQAAAGNYTAGALASAFTVAAKSQTITFAAPASPDNYGVVPVSLSASASSGLPITFSVLSGPASLNGSTLTVTGAGTIVIAADQSGSAAYVAATEVTHSITVNKIAPSTGLSASVTSVLLQNPVTLTATISSTVSTPTGSVAFSDSGTVIGTAALSGGVAALNVSSLAVGSHVITAVYSGDGNFSAVSSAAVAEAVQDFTLTTVGGTASQTIHPGGSAAYTLPFGSTGGATLPTAVTVTASGLPVGATASFAPASIAAGSGATNLVMTVQMPQLALLERSGPLGKSGVVVALGMLLLPYLRRKNGLAKRLQLLACMLLLAAAGSVVMLTGCGSGGSSSSANTGASQTGTYNITVTASSGALSHSTTVALIVQ